MSKGYPLVRGSSISPLVARAVLRDFGDGLCEVSAAAIRRDPGEVELFNAFLAANGSEERLLPRPALVASEAPKARVAESDAERVTRRAKQRVRHCCKAIRVDRLLTLTTRELVTDLKRSQALVAGFVRRVRAYYPGLQYVAVPELHKSGGIHWHIAFKGWVNVNVLRALWWRTLGVKVPRSMVRKPPKLGALSPGNVNIMTRKGSGKAGGRPTVWGADKLAGYVAKYIGKTLGQASGGAKWARSYLVPKGITFAVQRWYVRGEGLPDMHREARAILAAAGRGDWREFIGDMGFVWLASSGAAHAIGPEPPHVG